MNISLPDDLLRFVLERVDAGCYGSASEYVRTLVRRDRSERMERTALIAASPRPRRANDYMANAGESRESEQKA